VFHAQFNFDILADCVLGGKYRVLAVVKHHFIVKTLCVHCICGKKRVLCHLGGFLPRFEPRSKEKIAAHTRTKFTPSYISVVL